MSKHLLLWETAPKVSPSWSTHPQQVRALFIYLFNYILQNVDNHSVNQGRPGFHVCISQFQQGTYPPLCRYFICYFASLLSYFETKWCRFLTRYSSIVPQNKCIIISTITATTTITTTTCEVKRQAIENKRSAGHRVYMKFYLFIFKMLLFI